MALKLLLSALLVATVADLRGAVTEGRANLSQIFSGWPQWEESASRVEADVEAFSKLRERSTQSAEDLLRVLRARDAVHRGFRNVEGYVSLRLDLDAGDEEARQRLPRVQAILENWDSRASTWYGPRVIALGWEQIERWMNDEPDLHAYRYFLARMFRDEQHRLDEGEERILALADLGSQNTYKLHQAMNYIEGPQVSMRLSDGSDLELTAARVRSLLWQMENTGDRRQARRRWLEALGQRSETHAALLDGVVRREQFVAKARGHADALDAALYADAIPRSAVDTLLRVASERADSLRRYHRLRASALGLDDYGAADRFIPVAAFAGTIPYHDAQRLIIESAAPLGGEIQDIMRRAFRDGWIDAFERPGKRAFGGATLVYGSHPYVRVSYNGTLLDLLSLSHELGHAVHSLLSHQAQPFVSSTYSTLTGEAVANVHETLLVRRLIEETKEPVAVLDVTIQSLLRSFYTPAMDADFEIRLYRDGAVRTAKALSDLYRDRLESFYDKAVRIESWDDKGWAEVPHFFTSPLYMARYPLAYAAGSAIARDLTSGSASARERARRRYADLLRAGGSDDPVVLLARAGADLNDPATIEAVTDHLETLVNELARRLANAESGLNDDVGKKAKGR